MLIIPDVRMDPEGYDCGAACVDAVASFYGLRKRGPAKHIRTALGSLANPVQGVSPETIAAMLRAPGMTVLSGTLTVDDLKHFTQTRPVLCPVALHNGHWVVCSGVFRRRVHFHDPIDGAVSVPVATWEAAWHDTSEAGHAFTCWGVCPFKG